MSGSPRGVQRGLALLMCTAALACSQGERGLHDAERGRYVPPTSSDAADNADEPSARRTVVRAPELKRADLAAADAAAQQPADSVDGGLAAAAPPALSIETQPPPPAVDRELMHRLRHLLDAIAANDPALCHDVQLPRAAYLQDYAHADPSRLWDRVVDVSFRKSLARVHRKRRYDELRLVSLDTPKPMTQTIGSSRDGWKQPTWRVEGARLVTQLGGKAAARKAPGQDNSVIVPIGSLVYWRGAWYIERL